VRGTLDPADTFAPKAHTTIAMTPKHGTRVVVRRHAQPASASGLGSASGLA
jgi:hypothetical protein